MATMRRLSPEQYGEDDEGNDIGINPNLPPVRRPSTTGPHIHMPQPVSLGDFNLSNGQSSVPLRMTGQGLAETPHNNARVRMPPSLACVRAHLPHAVGDVAGSLLGFAILINSAILILAAAVFYYGDGQTARPDGVSDLFDAYELFKTVSSASSFYKGPPRLTYPHCSTVPWSRCECARVGPETLADVKRISQPLRIFSPSAC